jgi:hypothetical protein
MHRRAALLSVFSALSLALTVVFTSGGASAAGAAQATSARASAVKTSSLGQSSPTFTGTAATGCASGCSLLTGPVNTPSTASLASTGAASAKPAAGSAEPAPKAMPPPSHPLAGPSRSALARAATATGPGVPTISCPGPGCDTISSSSAGAHGVKGLNAVDSASLSTNFVGDIEPPDQGLCAGNGYVVEANNIGEIRVFDTALQHQSAAIPLDTVMGLTGKGWSSGGDPSCYYDQGNGGHWFFTEIVSASTEASGGPFAGCFAAVANTCYEGIAVSDGSNPFGPYHVYYLNANYDPSEPGYPSLLNDFAKISVTRDAFLLFYDEFPLSGSHPGLGGGFFNGAQEFAFNKNALEQGLPVTAGNGKPNQFFTVARENMGLLPTPDGTCAGTAPAGLDCWAAAIPAQPPDPSQYDNSNGGTGFMLAALDFPGFFGVPTSGDNRIAVFDWTGLANLNSTFCNKCGGIRFGGQLFTGVQPYVQQESLTQYPSGVPSAQKAGPIPLAGVSSANACLNGSTTPCPEGGLATNGDFMTQVSQAQGQIWGGTSTQINQTFSSEKSPEMHQAVAYWVVGTGPFDKSGTFSLTSQGYVSAAHEDLTMPAIGAEGGFSQDRGNGGAIMTFTLSGNGGPTKTHSGGYYPSTAYGRLTSTSNGLSGSVINIADPGQSPQDGFTEYQVVQFVPGFPVTRPRWGDYSWAIFSGGRIYFANEYIQSPNCTGAAFSLTVGTCGGTRDGFANWGTSVNWVVP